MSKTTNALIALGVVAGLSAAALPLSSYASEFPATAGSDPLKATGIVPVQLEVEETLSMYITDSDEEDDSADFTSPVVMASTDGEDFVSDPIAIKVVAKNKSGYYLTIHGSGNGTDATSLYNNATGEIKTGTDFTSTTVSAWGYKVKKGAENAAIDENYSAVKGEDGAVTIDKLEKAGTQTTEVTFGAHVVADQEAGVYNGQVTFTATAGAEPQNNA